MSEFTPPEGFSPLPLDGSFNDAFAPVYVHFEDSLPHSRPPQVGLRVEKHHLNSMGICHGAVYMALFDIGFACVVGFESGNYQTPTMNISIDYVSAAREGEWIWVEADCLKATRNTGFTNGLILSDSGVKARGSGLFKVTPPKQ